jgi:hypothetical protein
MLKFNMFFLFSYNWVSLYRKSKKIIKKISHHLTFPYPLPLLIPNPKISTFAVCTKLLCQKPIFQKI